MVFVLSYLLGSAPFGLLLGRAVGKDVRAEGSRNIGATNVWRVCGWKLGLLCFVLDFLKGLIPVTVIAGWFPLAAGWPYTGIAAAAGAVLGHNFPVWLRFKGGKGVATSAGAMAGLLWQPFLLAIGVFVATVWLTRYLSLGSMLASVALVVGTATLTHDPFGRNLPLFLLTVLLMIMLVYRHRPNIARIRAGTENKFPPPKKSPEEFI